MVNESTQVSRVFSALSNRTRRAILARLAQGAAPVSEIARPFAISQPAVTKHLNTLESVGLISRKQSGRQSVCRIDADPMKDAAAWMSKMRRFWDERLDALEAYLVESDETRNESRSSRVENNNLWVNYSVALDHSFSALADPTRRAMLAYLALGDATVKELAEPFRISAPAISKHLRTLERAGMIERRGEGRSRTVKLRAAPIREATAWIERYAPLWESRMNRLERRLNEEEKT